MKDFLFRQFDKLLLFALVVFFSLLALHIIHDSKDQAVINWGMTLVSGAVGALLVLITGSISKASANPNVKPE